MIGQLTGVLIEKNPPQILIDCHGIGYEVLVSMNTFYNLPICGTQVRILTQLQVREDAHLLYGFNSAQERECFRNLIKISGMGAKTALAVLSGMTVDELSLAVAQQNVTLLTKVPGIGKKTAERLLLELKGKLAEALPNVGNTPSTHAIHNDILQALMALGYSEKEASIAVKSLDAELDVSSGIKMALRTLAR